MNNLVRVIGPAPSEQTYEEFLARLTIERMRVSSSLMAFKAQEAMPKKKKGKSKTTSKLRPGVSKKAELMLALESKAEVLGISMEELLVKLKQPKETSEGDL